GPAMLATTSTRSSLRRLASRVARRRSSRPPRRGEVVVLMYHRIGTPGSPPGKLTVSPQRFADHLEAIQSRFETVPLATIVEGMRAGALPRRSVALTFDDGYVDNLLVAKPLLERFGVPATVFVVSGYVGTSKPFWWDE